MGFVFVSCFVTRGTQQSRFVFVDQTEVDFPTIQIDATDLHTHPGADGITNAGSFTAKFLAHFVELKVFATQLGHMDQALDIHRVQRDEDTEARGSGDHPREFFAQMVSHVFAFEPRLDIAAGLIGAALVGAAMQTCRFPTLQLLPPFFGGHLLFGRQGFGRFNATGQTLGQLAVGLSRRGQGWQLIALFPQNGLDNPMHQQIGVTPNGAGEVGVAFKRQAEMTAVKGRVNGLLHGAQQHGVNLLRIRPVFGGLGNGLEFTRRRVVADGHTDTRGAQVIGQQFALFRRGAFMHAEHAGVLALQNKVGAADIGRQHGLFDQAVRLVANTGHNFFNPTALITNNLGFGGLKINRTPPLTRLQQRAVNLVQMQQMRHQGFAARGLGASGIAQNGGHFGVGKPCVAEHHGRVKLISMDLALGVDQHVGHHAKTLDFGVQRTQPV